jgi:hypothetical protein
MKSEAKLQRRVLLKALGLGLSAPLAYKFSKLALAQSTRPKRMILFYFPHGVPNEHMDMEPYLMPGNELFKDYGANASAPSGASHVATDYNLTTRSGFNILSPLEPYLNQMSIVRGLHQSGNFGTHDSIGSILTGDAVHSSLDQLVAQEMAMKSLFLGSVTRVNDQLNLTHGVLSRNDAGWRTPENDVVKAYDNLFGNFTSVDPEPAADESAFRNQALDLTMSEITAMRSAVAGLTQEESKLSAHLAALENIKDQSQGLGNSGGDACNAAPTIPYLDELRAAKAAYTSNDGTEYWQEGSLAWKESDAEKKTNFTKIAESQAELAAHAVLCGQVQVATIQNGWASADYPLPQLLPNRPTDSYHVQVSHVGYTGDLTDAPRLDYATVQQWFIARMARMCEILDQPDPFDPEHTALENTIIYGFSEIGDGQLHTKSLERQWSSPEADQIFGYYPAIILGGGGGALAPGKLITVDNRPIADLLLTLAQAMGSGASNFSSLSTGPIGDLLA